MGRRRRPRRVRRPRGDLRAQVRRTEGLGRARGAQRCRARTPRGGGGQESGLRSGTSNVAGAAATAAALRVTCATPRRSRTQALRDRLADTLLRDVPGTVENGDRARKVAGNAHLRFDGIESEALLVALDVEGVCAAAGSSCASGATEPSYVLTAMGLAFARRRRRCGSVSGSPRPPPTSTARSR
ncbi:MAG: aminotransferase class V-fold PLP-dependent enzyme [Acidimicrobiia bacterium]